jgi:hypothetical protein
VIRRAVWAKAKPQEFSLPHGGFTLRLSEEEVRELIDAVRDEGGAYRGAPERLRGRLEAALIAQCAARRGCQVGDRAMAGDAQRIADNFRAVLAVSGFHELVLPDMKPRVLVERLLTDADILLSATRGVFGPAQRQALLRRRSRSGQFPWSDADLPLVAEAEYVIAGRSRSFGHVVVDEAQDLSPMQWRILLRRSNRRSLTILGDLAQTTGYHAAIGWTDLLDNLGLTEVASVVALTVGYRVPAPILEFACRLLPSAYPGLPAPSSIRGGAPPVVRRVPRGEMVDVLAGIATQNGAGQTAIIVADANLDQVRAGLRARHVAFGELAEDGLTEPVILMTPETAKGLEFDHVVVVDPRAIAGRTRRGLRLLFISLTRATKHLTVLHSDPLPKALAGDGPPHVRGPLSAMTAPGPAAGDEATMEETERHDSAKTEIVTVPSAESEPPAVSGGPSVVSTDLDSRASPTVIPDPDIHGSHGEVTIDLSKPGQKLRKVFNRAFRAGPR